MKAEDKERVRCIAERNRAWADLRGWRGDIERIASDGPSAGDHDCIRKVFLVVLGDMILRECGNELDD